MTISARELAYFGGWTRRVFAGGSFVWGSPLERVVEVVPSVSSNLTLPPPSPFLQPGAQYWVVNTGAANCVLKRPSDSATVLTVAPNSVAVFAFGGEWMGWQRGAPQFGPANPALRMSFDISTNVANYVLLQQAIADGYDGTQPVALTCRVRAGAAVGSVTAGLRSWDTGNTISSISWAAGSYVHLIVDADGLVGGWGGNAGRGGTPLTGHANGYDGSPGGQAIRTWIPLRVTCNGTIFGGGGGGGGGGSSSTVATIVGGGGGGGCGANMTPGGVLVGSLAGGASSPAGGGQPGGPFGPGGEAVVDPLTGALIRIIGGQGTGGGGNGGGGGGAALNGWTGGASSTGTAGGAGGAAAAAISYLTAAGAPTILVGSVIGSTIAEAS